LCSPFLVRQPACRHRTVPTRCRLIAATELKAALPGFLRIGRAN
jgi:hypothetical protein